jgi:hypothetical protein
MRFFSIQTIAYLITVSPLAGVFASPVGQLTPTAVHHERELDTRAPPPKVIHHWVVLEALKDVHDTYTGVKPIANTVFGVPLSDTQVLDAAEKTFDEWDKNPIHKGKSLLVAAIAVPGYGLAAGTIWHGTSDNQFQTLAQASAPKLAALVTNLAVQGSCTASKWHAEVVASWVAESRFPGSKSGSPSGTEWPVGSKIAVYGRERNKVACSLRAQTLYPVRAY